MCLSTNASLRPRTSWAACGDVARTAGGQASAGRTLAVTVKRRGSPAPQTASGSASARPGSIYDASYENSVAALRDAMDDEELDTAWAEGAALSTDEAIAYAQRRRGERKRPTSGWASLTPTERDVVRLVSEGLANKDVAARLFVSPRTVQSHLTHVYTKLGLTSRVQLAQEAARHG
jgi:DNA-binding CsgD family transcriptional regulator